jgi:flagellum-specific ATP synthase
VEETLSELAQIKSYHIEGKVTAIKGLLIECSGIEQILSVGSRCLVVHQRAEQQDGIICEVLGFKDNTTLLMPFGNLEGIGLGSRVVFLEPESSVYPDESWLGRVVNALGEPADDKGPLIRGTRAYPYRNAPPDAHRRQRVGSKMDLGVRALNTFIPCCYGQRMGIFAGSGVGKSILMSMLSRYSQADVNVIGLVGERGREVQEFIEDNLGEEGLKRSVVITATSSESALMRKYAAYMTLCVAEYFRDQGKQVLCMVDSVTRFAMAQREIGLSSGEPPTSKGYPPTVFSELSSLLERAGPGAQGQGSITGIFTVLVEGDDDNEPISDAVRGILDGHIVMSRDIAQRGRYPAIDILKSVSRMLPDCNNEAENTVLQVARNHLSSYEDMAEMIRLGAYRQGSNQAVDNAIRYYPEIENFLKQAKQEYTSLNEGYQQLAQILNVPWAPAGREVADAE